MRKPSPAKSLPPRSKSRLIYSLMILMIGLSVHSCTDLLVGRELKAVGDGVQMFASDLATALDKHNDTRTPGAPNSGYTDDATTIHATGDFSACRNFFANCSGSRLKTVMLAISGFSCSN